MNKLDASKRRLLTGALAAAGSWVLAGCDRLGQTSWFPKILATGETVSRNAHQLLGGRRSMAQEFTDADLSPSFRGNGSVSVSDPKYQLMAQTGFAQWALKVDGLVETPANLSLAELHAMPARTQITRHDCVEGWSAIGKWTGVPLAAVLEKVKPKANARYVVFHCADLYGSSGSQAPYYESIDMEDAFHPQTILAYGLNGAALPVMNGAPLRLRVERQLGYKHAKFISRIELVDSFDKIEGGKGGYWEDRGYQWYAGI